MLRLTIGACGAGEAILLSSAIQLWEGLEHRLYVRLLTAHGAREELAVHVHHHLSIFVSF